MAIQFLNHPFPPAMIGEVLSISSRSIDVLTAFPQPLIQRGQIFFALQHERLLDWRWSLSFVVLRKATSSAVVFLSTSPNLMSPCSWQILIQITSCYLTKSKSNRVNFRLSQDQLLLLLAYDQRLVCFIVLLSFVSFASQLVFRNSFPVITVDG